MEVEDLRVAGRWFRSLQCVCGLHETSLSVSAYCVLCCTVLSVRRGHPWAQWAMTSLGKPSIKKTIFLLTFVNKRFTPPPYLLTKNHYIKNVSKNTEKQLICIISQPPEPPVLQPL